MQASGNRLEWKCFVFQEPSTKKNLLVGRPGYGEGGAAIEYIYVSYPEDKNFPVDFPKVLIVEFSASFSSRVKQPNFGFAVYNEENTMIFSSSFIHEGIIVDSVDIGEKISGILEIEWNITPGTYFFTFILSENAGAASRDMARQLDVREGVGPVVMDRLTGFPDFEGAGWLPSRVASIHVDAENR